MRWNSPSHLLGCLVFLAMLIPAMGRLAVMSIDLGSEFMKIAIVKPGVPMEIVLNKESSRKTQSIVAFRDGDRHFANDAHNTLIKFPSKAFWFLTHIIGRSYEDPLVEQFRQRFPYYSDIMVKDEERGTVHFRVHDDTLYSTEELIGMMLEKAREYAQDFAEQEVKDVVITVPPYYTQAERRAILAAADLVGLNVLQLMNDNTAVALNYGVFRRKMFSNITQYYLFYDMGTTSTVATIVGYQMVKTKEGTRVETNPQLTIKGVGYDRNLGGLEMTLRLRDHMAQVFNSQKERPVKVEDNPRAMAKLLKEAERVKKVLSANNEHKAQVEGLLEGEDFAAKITREVYLNLIQDVLDRVYISVEDVLKSSEITMPEITEIILMGGGSRMPRVQEILIEKSGKTELGKSVNTDEAAALGAVYQAAFLGKGFKVKTFHIKDANLFPINVEFDKQKDDGASETKTIKRTLFGRLNPFPQRKVMTFNKHFKDFNFDVRYGDLDFLSGEERKAFPSSLLTNVTLHGVETAVQKHANTDVEYRGVKAHFRMDESGILHLERVEAVFEKQQAGEVEEEEIIKDESTWSKIGNAFGGLFGAEEGEASTKQADINQTETASRESEATKSGTDKSEQDQKTEEKVKDKKANKADEKIKESEEEDPASKAGEDDSAGGEGEERREEAKEPAEKPVGEEKSDGKSEDKEGSKSADKEDKVEKKAAAPKVVTLKEDIQVEVDVKDLPNLSKSMVTEAKTRLAALAKKDAEKAALQKAKNELEGFIFDTQDKLNQNTYEICSTAGERESILKALSEASSWFEEQSEDAKKEVFTSKLKDLKELMKNINLRVYEKEERPKALAALKDHLNSSTVFLATVRNMTELIFTEVEITGLEKLINETKKWRDEAVAEQKKVPDYENPTLLVEAIGSKIYALEREIKYLINKAKNYRPKVKTDSKDNKTEKAEKTQEEKKDEEYKKEGGEDEADGNVEDENEDGTPVVLDSQEATEGKDQKPEETLEKPEKTEAEPEETLEKSEKKLEKPKVVREDKSEKTGQKKRLKKKTVEKATKEEEDILELGSDDLPADSTAEKHEEL